MQDPQLSSKHRAFYIFDRIFHCVLSLLLSLIGKQTGTGWGLNLTNEGSPLSCRLQLLGVNTQFFRGSPLSPYLSASEHHGFCALLVIGEGALGLLVISVPCWSLLQDVSDIFPGYHGLVAREEWLLHLVFWGLCLILSRSPCPLWPSCPNCRPLYILWPLSVSVSSHRCLWKLLDSICTKCRLWGARAPKHYVGQINLPGKGTNFLGFQYKCRRLEGGEGWD